MSEENITLVKQFLDSCLDGEAIEDFVRMVDVGGLYGVIRLCEAIDYNHSDELTNLAIEHVFKDVTCTHAKTLFVFGVRHPNSELYSWDGAVVFHKLQGDAMITTTTFDDNVDHVIYAYNYKEVLKQYKQYLQKGWKAMNKDDVQKTSGILIDKDTRMCPYNRKARRAIISCVVGICSLVLFTRML